MTSPIAYQNKPLKGFDTAPEFLKYRRRGEYRVIRCDFPQLMGWSTLRRPPGLPRSLKTPYFAGEFAPLSLGISKILQFEPMKLTMRASILQVKNAYIALM